MDKIEKYRKVLQDLMLSYTQYKPSHGQIDSIAVCDTVRDEYLLLAVGWDRPGRVHDIIVHARIKNEKIIIEWDGIETGVAQDMINAGVAEEDIVFASYSDYVQGSDSVRDIAVA